MIYLPPADSETFCRLLQAEEPGRAEPGDAGRVSSRAAAASGCDIPGETETLLRQQWKNNQRAKKK